MYWRGIPSQGVIKRFQIWLWLRRCYKVNNNSWERTKWRPRKLCFPSLLLESVYIFGNYFCCSVWISSSSALMELHQRTFVLYELEWKGLRASAAKRGRISYKLEPPSACTNLLIELQCLTKTSGFSIDFCISLLRFLQVSGNNL